MVYRILLFALLVLPISVSSSDHECSTNVCSTFYFDGMPLSLSRRCYLGLEKSCWQDSFCGPNSYHCFRPCVGFVGTNFTVLCDFSDGARLYKDGVYLNSSTVNYVYLLQQHAGFYECRNSSGVSIAAQNVTVNVNPRITVLGSNCYDGITDCQDNHCCSISKDIYPTLIGDEPFSYEFGVLGENVTFTVDNVTWIKDSDTRSEVNLGLSTVQNKTHPAVWTLMIPYPPKKVTSNQPSIKFRVTASNPTSSYSLCFLITFYGSKPVVIVHDDKLPVNAEVQEGQNATFQCKFAVDQNANSFSFGFEIEQSAVIGNKTVSSSSMVTYELSFENYFTSYNCSSDCLFVVEYDEEASNGLSSIFIFNITVFDVSKETNNSIVSCSLFHTFKESSILQWKKEATLLVRRSTSTNTSTSNVRYVSIGLVFAVLLVVTVVAMAITAFIRRKKDQTQREMNPDEIPLRRDSNDFCGSEATSPVTQDQQVLYMEISDDRYTRNGGLIVGDHFPGRNSGDNMDTDIHFNSLIQQSDTSESFYESLSESSKFVVYISYTDRKGLWVRTKLKPLIQSWHSAIEVNLHENSMIPGFAVSSERHRLILEADKIIIVVSRDYSNSPWCLYELEHAIHQKPSLCNGRIIPILTDHCRSLPSIISGVVHLSDQETNFSTRLQQAIFKMPRRIHCSDVI